MVTLSGYIITKLANGNVEYRSPWRPRWDQGDGGCTRASHLWSFSF